jgi:hypothetical protein
MLFYVLLRFLLGLVDLVLLPETRLVVLLLSGVLAALDQGHALLQ